MSGSSRQLTLKKGAPGDQVPDLLCMQLANYLIGGPLMHMHIYQKFDYDMIMKFFVRFEPKIELIFYVYVGC